MSIKLLQVGWRIVAVMDYGAFLGQAVGPVFEAYERRDETLLDRDNLFDLYHSWVMLKDSGEFEPLPHEVPLLKREGRVALDISASSTAQGVPRYSRRCDRGVAFLTNKRIIYLPNPATSDFQSYATHILNCDDAHPGNSWLIGPAYWEASVKTVPGGGIPPDYPRHNIKFTFYDGGHSEWAIKFEDQKGRLHQTAQFAQETGRPDLLNDITGEQLPEYTPREGDQTQSQMESSQARIEAQAEAARRQRDANLPDENPPDYDEAQLQAVNQRLDERAQEDAERQ